jgi:hypothetical protein
MLAGRATQSKPDVTGASKWIGKSKPLNSSLVLRMHAKRCIAQYGVFVVRVQHRLFCTCKARRSSSFFEQECGYTTKKEQSMSTELQKIENHDGPAELMRQSTDVAGVCREIVKRTARTIGNRQYVQVEGWQSIATAHGCMPSIAKVEMLPDGSVIAIAELRRMSDGIVLATAEGYVGMDESTWGGRAAYARRAMAQTRAMSRVCRTAFAHVVVLIDENLSTTPAEEVQEGGFVEPANAPSKPTYTQRPPDGRAPAPDRKARPTADGIQTFRVTIHDVIVIREGNSDKGPWTLIGVMCTCDNQPMQFKTFDTSWADYAKAGKGQLADIEAKPGKRAGDWDITYIAAVVPDANQAPATESQAEEDAGADDIPFDPPQHGRQVDPYDNGHGGRYTAGGD